MCGLFGTIRPHHYDTGVSRVAAAALLDLGCLAEERGTDSAGIATLHRRTLTAGPAADLVSRAHSKTTGRTIRRIIASFSQVDMLYASKLHPSTFLEQGSVQRLNLPHMMWQLDDDKWVGVESVNVGYGGTGGGYARNALVCAGIDKDLADEISWWRYSDTDVTGVHRLRGTAGH